MISTKGTGYYLQILITLFIFNCVLIFAYSEEPLGSRDEPELRKLVPNTKVVNTKKSEATTKRINVATSMLENTASTKNGFAFNHHDNTNKYVNKRQQFSQAKPIIQLANQRADPPKKRVDSCPLCDSSVFSYCSDKLLHDACCCLNPYENNLPYQCQYADCSFLHANTCREHHLITACCCDRYLF